MAKTFLTQLTNAAQTVTYESSGAGVTESRRMDVRVIAPDAPGDYPVVFYSHGHSANPAGAGSLNARAIADQGYIVILPTHLDSAANPASIRNAYTFENPASTLHRVADIQHAFDQLPLLMAAAAGYAALTETPIIAGHSHGSRVASLLAGATTGDPTYDDPQPGNPYGLEAVADARFRGAVLLSPAGIGDPSAPGQKFTADSWSQFDLPALMLTGTLDTTPVEDDYVARLDGFGLSPASGKHAVVLEGADHTDIGGFSATPEQTAAVTQAVAAFLDAYVRGGANALNDPASFLTANAQFREVYARNSGLNSGAAQGGDAGDAIHGFGTNDSISGLGGDDSLNGNDGNDTLDGGIGADSLDGGAGDDIYMVDDAGDVVTETAGQGADTVRSSLSHSLRDHVENLTLTGSGGTTGIGNSLSNLLIGNSGNNILDGGTGADAMIGGAGNDSYTFDNSGDTASELAGEGLDTVFSSVAHTLRDNFENLTLTGSGDINASGNNLANLLLGNGGNNILDGGTGADAMRGGAGNDRYTFDDAGDTASELAGEGTDTVISSVAHTLRPDFENLTIIGSATNAFGSSVANILTGNALNNILNGREANDIMTGGAGIDTFMFDTALGPTNVDRITDFVAVDDVFRLAATIFTGIGAGVVAATAFHLGTSAADASDRIIYNQATGQVFYDADGLGGVAQVLFAVLDTKPVNVTNADFVVI